MTIRAREEDLFQRWRTRRTEFVPDGVVDEVRYQASIPKILLIMKEFNGIKEDGWDLRRFLYEGGRAQTWDNVTRRVRAIRGLPDELTWHELAAVTTAQRISTLRTIAVMNLKKTAGGSKTDNDELESFATEDRVLLREQADFYGPDLVIFCGPAVTRIFTDIVSPSSRDGWATTTRGVRFRELTPGRFMLDFCHPMLHGRNENLVCYGLVDAIKELCGHARPSGTAREGG